MKFSCKIGKILSLVMGHLVVLDDLFDSHISINELHEACVFWRDVFDLDAKHSDCILAIFRDQLPHPPTARNPNYRGSRCLTLTSGQPMYPNTRKKIKGGIAV